MSDQLQPEKKKDKGDSEEISEIEAEIGQTGGTRTQKKNNDDKSQSLDEDIQKDKKNSIIKDKKKKKKFCLIYPSNEAKMIWDLFTACILIYSCMTTPANIAFSYQQGDFWIWIDQSINIVFLIDIILTFNSAFEDSNLKVIDDRCVIIKNYLTGWFLLDFTSIFPFDQILQNSNYNSLVRIFRIGRLYRLVRLTKLKKILKNIVDHSRIIRGIMEFLKIGDGVQRLVTFLFLFIILCHLVSCVYVILANFISPDNLGTGCWMNPYISQPGFGSGDLYVVSFYWTIQTITTVGYGDVYTTNTIERIYACIIMILGVLSFSFASGSLSSIISNLDSKNALLKYKLEIIEGIRKDFKLPKKLYIKVKNNIEKVDHTAQQMDHFISQLPHQLSIQIQIYNNQEKFKHLNFMKNKTLSFISWFCKQVKNIHGEKNDYIYREDEEISMIYFVHEQGKLSFVIQKYNNTPFVNITLGETFGQLDLHVCSIMEEREIEEKNKMYFKRYFTVMALSEFSILGLSINDLLLLKIEYNEYFEELFRNKNQILYQMVKLKLKAYKSFQRQKKNMKKDAEKKQKSFMAMKQEIKYKFKAINKSNLDLDILESSDQQSSSSQFSLSSSDLDVQNQYSDQYTSDSNEKEKVESIQIDDQEEKEYKLTSKFLLNQKYAKTSKTYIDELNNIIKVVKSIMQNDDEKNLIDQKNGLPTLRMRNKSLVFLKNESMKSSQLKSVTFEKCKTFSEFSNRQLYRDKFQTQQTIMNKKQIQNENQQIESKKKTFQLTKKNQITPFDQTLIESNLRITQQTIQEAKQRIQGKLSSYPLQLAQSNENVLIKLKSECNVINDKVKKMDAIIKQQQQQEIQSVSNHNQMHVQEIKAFSHKIQKYNQKQFQTSRLTFDQQIKDQNDEVTKYVQKYIARIKTQSSSQLALDKEIQQQQQ